MPRLLFCVYVCNYLREWELGDVNQKCIKNAKLVAFIYLSAFNLMSIFSRHRTKCLLKTPCVNGFSPKNNFPFDFRAIGLRLFVSGHLMGIKIPGCLIK